MPPPERLVLTVALDFDGVTYPFTRAVSAWAAEMGRADLPVEPDAWAYWREAGLDDNEWAELLGAFADDDGYRREAPYPEALEGMNSLFDAGCDLLGVTSRPPSRVVHTSTFGWVADWMLPLRAVLIGPNAKLEAECDLVVDDDPKVLAALDDLGEAAGLLLDRPWNREAEGPRVGWGELPAAVAVLADAVAGVPPSERKWALVDAVADFFCEAPGQDW